jgi:hypothetical protein
VEPLQNGKGGPSLNVSFNQVTPLLIHEAAVEKKNTQLVCPQRKTQTVAHGY